LPLGPVDLKIEMTPDRYIKLTPDQKKLDLPSLRKGECWIPSEKMLVYEFRNYVNRLSLGLVIGPGPQEIRQKLFEMAKKEKDILKPSSKTLPALFCTIFTRDFLKQKDYESATLENLKPKIDKAWDFFLNHEAPKIEKILTSQPWI